jgi:excisionase family DNA binding protein
MSQEARMLSNPLMLSIRDACRSSALGRTTIYKLIGLHKIRAVKVGSKTLVDAQSLQDFLAGLPPARIRSAEKTPNSRPAEIALTQR